MKTGDIIFCRQKSFISHLIQFLDKGRFSHVGVYVEPNQIFEINYNYSARLNPFHYDDYVVIDLNLTDTQRNNMIVYMDQLKGDYYDWKKFIWLALYRTFGIDIPWIDDSHKYVCSELVTALLAMVGRIPSSDVGRYTPNSLYEYLTSLK